MNKRNPGLDLLRCFATFMVVTAHSFLSNGYTITPQTGITMWLAGSVQLMCRCSVGIFLMLTGYLQSNKTDWRSCYRGLPAVLLSYFLAAAISIPIRHFVYGDMQSLTAWIQRLFGYSGAYYGWYVEIYVGLTLLTPFINMSLKHSDTKALFGYAAILLFLTALPGLTPWVVVSGYWKFLYPLSFYILGAIVRRVQPRIKPIYGILAALTSGLLMGAGTVLSTDGLFRDAITWDFGDLGMAVVSAGLFIGMYRVKLSDRLSKFFAVAATGSFGAYLLSHLLDAWCYKLIIPWKQDGRYLLIFLCVTVPIYIASMIMGIGLDKFTRWIISLGHKVEGAIKNRICKETC